MLFTLSVVVQLQSCVQLLVTPWNATCQASLSSTISTISWSLSIESGMPFNHLMLCHPFLLLPSILPSISLFQWKSLFQSLFTTGSWSIGASASILLMNIQGWFLLGLTSFISLQSKGLGHLQHNSKASILQRSTFLMANSHIHTWLLEKP